MKTIYYITALIFSVSPLSAETANELAGKIIKKQIEGSYTATDESAEEFARARAFNSKKVVGWLTTSDAGISEEFRICYAIYLLDEKISDHYFSRKPILSITEQRQILKQRFVLSSRLAEIIEAKINHVAPSRDTKDSEVRSH